MPTRAQVQELIDLVEQRREVDAIRKFYAEDAQSRENQAAPTVGLANLVAKEQRFLDSIQAMHTARALSFLVDGDLAAINWLFEFTDGQGRRMRMDEVAYQRWQGGKIVSEQYYYDPAALPVREAS
jgi:ketosteroid isomerase-like protein